MGMYNMIDQTGNYWQNAFKIDNFNKTLDLYKQDLKIREDAIKAANESENQGSTKAYKPVRNYFINNASKNKKRQVNPFTYSKPATYKDLTGQWLATPYMYQAPNIPKINIYTGKYM